MISSNIHLISSWTLIPTEFIACTRQPLLILDRVPEALNYVLHHNQFNQMTCTGFADVTMHDRWWFLNSLLLFWHFREKLNDYLLLPISPNRWLDSKSLLVCAPLKPMLLYPSGFRRPGLENENYNDQSDFFPSGLLWYGFSSSDISS